MDRRLFGSLAIAIVTAVGMASAAKPPKAQDLTATTTFRCYTGEPSSGLCGLPVADGTDRIRDDGNEYPSPTGLLQTNGLYWLRLYPTDFRSLKLRLGTEIPSSRLCEDAGNCNPDPYVFGNGIDPVALDNVLIEVKPLVGLNDLPGLLWGMMTCGNPTDAIVKYTFWLPSGNGHWGLNFNERGSPNTTNASITRDSNLQWTVVSKMFSKGELFSWGHTGLLRPHTGPSREGLYYVNFKFTIVASGTPASVCTP